MPEPDDNTLVQRIILGDVGLYRTIVEKHKAKIFYLGIKFFHNAEDAEDFVQEVFLRAFEKLGSFRAEVPFGAWLYRLAFNSAVNKYRFDRKRLTDTEEIDLLQETLTGKEALLENNFFRSELQDRIRETLKRLPPVYSIVIKMHFFDRFTYGEISEIIDVPVNTIKSHILRAKKLLKKLLEDATEL